MSREDSKMVSDLVGEVARAICECDAAGSISLPSARLVAKGVLEHLGFLGYAVLPKEPSDAMVQRGINAAWLAYDDREKAARDTYRAMLTAHSGKG